MKRHLARTNTGQKIVVVFMQIPDREDHALVISTDNLPPRWEQYIMQIVESAEGQSDPDLGNVLGRRLMPDTTDTVLAALHGAGLLHPIHIDRVTMMPEPNRPYALRQILQAMNRIVPDEYEIANKMNENATQAARGALAELNSPPEFTTPAAQNFPAASGNEANKFNPHTVNQAAGVSQQSEAIAHNLLLEAEMLEADANAKRARAYAAAPHLRPQARAIVPPVETIPTKTPAKRASPARKKSGTA